jgi:hypothetical protein
MVPSQSALLTMRAALPLAPKSETFELLADARDVDRDLIRVEQHPLLRLPLRSPIMPVPPPTIAVSESLQTANPITVSKEPT